MMDEFFAELKTVSNIVTPQGEIAWRLEDVFSVIEIARKHGRIILGGDILTSLGSHTYDSWYYNLDNSVSAITNVEQSLDKCLQYIDNYIKRNGNQFLSVIVFN